MTNPELLTREICDAVNDAYEQGCTRLEIVVVCLTVACSVMKLEHADLTEMLALARSAWERHQ